MIHDTTFWPMSMVSTLLLPIHSVKGLRDLLSPWRTKHKKENKKAGPSASCWSLFVLFRSFSPASNSSSVFYFKHWYNHSFSWSSCSCLLLPLSPHAHIHTADPNDRELSDFMPVSSLTRREGKRPGIMLRFRPPNPNEGTIRVYPGKLK